MLPDRPVKVLIAGGGGREHALCWKLAQSPAVAAIYCAPGNGGTASTDKTTNVRIGVMEFDKIAGFCLEQKIDLVVVGPDDPLAAGLVDHLEARGLRVFGPSRQASKLEWSKAHAKEFMARHGIPTARYAVCNSQSEADKLVSGHDWARVIKVDGLALGKGVFVCDSQAEATAAVKEIFEARRFGQAGNRVVIEEKLEGEELSLLAFCDGKRLLPLPPCQDHKRRFDGDRGPNTGGMGAYSPVPIFDRCRAEIESRVLAPLEAALRQGAPEYKGVLYIGLMVCAGDPDSSGAYKPHVLEFNARFGDPETQALLPRLKSDLLPVLWACTEGALDGAEVDWLEAASCCVVAVAETYPNSSSRGQPIEIGALPPDVVLFHAGTAVSRGKLETNGGRIISVTALAPTIDAAGEKAYAALKNVSFPGMAYRLDIGRRAATRCH